MWESLEIGWNSFKNISILLLNTLSILIYKLYLFIVIEFSKFIRLNRNSKILYLVKLLCFLLLFCNAIQLSAQYLSFQYNYELIVFDNKHGFEFPDISLCTETNVFFDKR